MEIESQGGFMRTKLYPFFAIIFLLFFISFPRICAAWEKGIYINQTTLENTQYLTYLINQAKSVGINTFIVDLGRLSEKYKQNIKLVTDNNIKYVARIIVFHDGGTNDQILSEPYWEKRYQLMREAVALGAKEIQLDYIRYNTRQGASPVHTRNIYRVISWYQNKIHELGVPLQIDVFGITSFGEEQHIGQNVRLFSNIVDAICPMNYPSHFEPFREHAVTPYETVYHALKSMKSELEDAKPVRLYSYIELSNYRYPLSNPERLRYIRAEIKAVEDANISGWYAWSPNNLYDNLFKVLRTTQVR